jgi:two-component system, response regulator PdtaR
MDAPGRLRILVVEDESLIALDLAQLLDEFGYEVCAIARTADEAIQEAARHRPDLVLTDVRLARGTSGVDAARRIRAEFGIPSCFVSGSIDRELMDQARACAPLGFVSKPFRPSVLRAMLAQASHASVGGFA